MLRTVLLLLGLAGAAPAIASDAPAKSPARNPDDVEQAELVVQRAADARAHAWSSYCTAVAQQLSQSPLVRDWALATLLPKARIEPGDETCGIVGRAMLQRAVEHAPDDVMVQWIAAHSQDMDASIAHAAEARLKTLEPENALVWFGDLADATRRHDANDIDGAMRRIGSSSHYDEHFTQVFGALIDVFRRYPVPETLLSVADEEERRGGRDGVAYSRALNATVTVSFSSFQDLVAACRIDPQTGYNLAHTPDCAAVARLMVHETDSVLANRIGYALLRVSRAYSEADVRSARLDDWVYSQAQRLMKSDAGDTSGDEVRAYINDWLDTRSELQAMRRKLLRIGVSAEPPAEWEDDNSPFSAQRLQQDAEQLSKQRAG